MQNLQSKAAESKRISRGGVYGAGTFVKMLCSLSEMFSEMEDNSVAERERGRDRERERERAREREREIKLPSRARVRIVRNAEPVTGRKGELPSENAITYMTFIRTCQSHGRIPDMTV